MERLEFSTNILVKQALAGNAIRQVKTCHCKWLRLEIGLLDFNFRKMEPL